MSARIIDGKKISGDIKAEVAEEIRELHKLGIRPQLAAILVGDNPASKIYIKNKEQACAEAGIDHQTIRLTSETTQTELLNRIERLNEDVAVSGILVQLPLPPHINESAVIDAISVQKDVDCFHPYNIGRLMTGEALFLPCTPAGVVELLIREGYIPNGMHIVIVGRSNIVGKPLANMLVQKSSRANATVTLCHTGTADMASITRQADILIAAAGKPGMITADMLKSGAVVIDVGINRVEDKASKSGFRLVGDVDYESAKEIASAITPVPGGVGPMTIAMLLKNTILAARKIAGR